MHGGFTKGTPWMRVNDDYKLWNVQAESQDGDSVLEFWKKALKLRKAHEVLVWHNVSIDIFFIGDNVVVRSTGKVSSAASDLVWRCGSTSRSSTPRTMR